MKSGDVKTKDCSCGARLYMVVDAHTGKRHPLANGPHPNGNIVVERLGPHEARARVCKDHRAAQVLARLLDEDPEKLYLNHFADCPDAAMHRKEGRPTDQAELSS